MKGPILGIVAVFLLQLGVIGYGTISRFFDAPVEVGSIAVPAQPLAMLSDLDFVEGDIVAVGEQGVFSPTLVSARGTAAVRPRSITDKRPGFRSFDTDFRPVTITVPTPSPHTFAVYEPPPSRTEYPLTQASDRVPVSFEISAQGTKVRDGRGFFSKTLNVIKKPYVWVKAVGSKLK